MIVDCFTHTWEAVDQLGRCVPAGGWGGNHQQLPGGATGASLARHFAAAEPVDLTFVLGFKSRWLDAEISNDHVASYVRKHPDRLLGFSGVDPSDPIVAIAELTRAREELAMPGLAVAPAAQDFHPSNSNAMQVYAEAAENGMPIVFHGGIYVATACKLEYARPVLLDEVARELPDLKIIVAHLGYPWVNETILLLAKHRNVYAEISWITHHPWEAYQALLSASQFGVMDKLLFGSGFPRATASQCIEALYSINHLVHGTNLPTIPRDQLRSVVERDTPSLLGIQAPRPKPEREPVATTVSAGRDEA